MGCVATKSKEFQLEVASYEVELQLGSVVVESGVLHLGMSGNLWNGKLHPKVLQLRWKQVVGVDIRWLATRNQGKIVIMLPTRWR